jgi:hypothetical protein
VLLILQQVHRRRAGHGPAADRTYRRQPGSYDELLPTHQASPRAG